VNMYTVNSDAPENETIVIQYNNGSVINLNSSELVEYIGFNTPTRFVGVRYEWLSANNVRYAGAALYGRLV